MYSRTSSRLALALTSALLLFAPARAADDFRKFLPKPETAMEFWQAMRFEISVGKYDIAALHLKSFIEKMPTDEELLKLEETEGMSTFLRLLTIPETRKDAGPIIERVSAVVKKVRSDPERIKKFVKNLSATEEERAYALTELRKSGAIVIPYLVEYLRDEKEHEAHVPILSGLIALNRDTVPPLLAALDVPEPHIRAELIDVLRERREKSAIPDLYYYAASPKQPELVRRHATTALISLLGLEGSKVPPAKFALTKEAERYFNHKMKFLDPAAVTVWQWDATNQKMVVPPVKMTATHAEEYYGLRYARQALELDPTYRPAQVVFLSLALEKAYERAGIDQPIEKGSPAIKDLMRSVNSELLMDIIERGLAERRTPVILGAVKALGELTDVRATRTKVSQSPALAKALSYPDPRVQMAAADAILRIPGPPPPQSTGRILDILRRAAAGEVISKAIIADPNPQRAEAVGAAVKEVGFEPMLVANGRDLMRRLADTPDIDVIFIDHNLPDPGMSYLLAQIRADVNAGNLPVFITISPDRAGRYSLESELSMRRQAERYRNMWVMRTNLDPEALKKLIPDRVTEALGKMLTPEERKAYANDAMVWLNRMSAGEVAGFDARPAEAVILKALQSETLRPLAIEAMRGLPGRVPQRELAAFVLTKDNPPELRSAAAAELSRHIQQHGLALDRAQIQALIALFQTAEDPKLKGNVALVVGSMRPTNTKTGVRLQGYIPPPPPAVEEKEPEKPKEKEKGEDKGKEKEKGEDKGKEKEKDKEKDKDKDN